MKQINQHEAMINYGDHHKVSSRRRRTGSSATTYNDRSPEVAAINAHLRAASYPAQEGEKQGNSPSRLTNAKARIRKRLHPLLRLSQQYDTQARDNFVREGVLFALLVTASVWPIVHSVRAIIAMW